MLYKNAILNIMIHSRFNIAADYHQVKLDTIFVIEVQNTDS